MICFKINIILAAQKMLYIKPDIYQLINIIKYINDDSSIGMDDLAQSDLWTLTSFGNTFGTM